MPALFHRVGSFATVRVCRPIAPERAHEQVRLRPLVFLEAAFSDSGTAPWCLDGFPTWFSAILTRRATASQFAVKIVKLTGQASTRVLSSRMVRVPGPGTLGGHLE